jgi:hypothetical protein
MFVLLSKPLARVGVTHRRHEEAEAEGHHEDVQHQLLLWYRRGRTNGLLLLGAEVPSGA